MKRLSGRERGFTIVELTIGIAVFAIMAMSFLTLLTSLINSATIAKEKAVATTLATNQMEYLRSQPYDSLQAYSNTSQNETFDGIQYTVVSLITYVDDAYDGCGTYQSQTIEQQECRNYPPPTGSSTDTNPADYKLLQITVKDRGGDQLAEVDTEIAARVSETASTTGALFVTVLDDSGTPVSGATITVTNTNKLPSPLTDTTDSNGIAIFYGMPPDTSGNHYTISATKSGYSSLTTIPPSGSLQPNYSSQNILTQQSSYVTLTLKPQGANSLIVETTDTNGTPLPNAKIYIKGGYKKYTATTDTSYYYDNMSPSDNRLTTDSSGLAALTNLVPGPYYFCGDSGSSSCTVGSTTYYLAAAVPYGGSSALEPVAIPTYDPSNPPSQTFSYNSTNYLQKVRLMLTTSSTFPRLTQLSPSSESATDPGLSSFSFVLTGVNLPCSASAGSCTTSVKIVQGSNTYTASCTGDSSGLQLNCSVDLTGITSGNTQLIINNGSGTLSLPASPLIGGIIVTSS